MTRITRMHTDTIDSFFVFNQKGETKRVIFTNDRKERFESETPNPCVSVESVASVFPSF
ncbi:MAG: hypothetical protein Q8M95_12785 [Candidatus Methanoperedens sp.]|nr:hypothetical protein [Candidatus Methanoperedens sp.]